jgi:hypothetical protein
MRRLASTAAVLALVVLPSAAQAEQPPGLDIPAGGFSSDMNAQDGRLVWKVSARAGSSRLMTAANGQAFELPVKPLPAGFIDVALGRDAQGRVVATYARCDRPRTGQPPENCDPYAYTFTDPDSAAGQERRLPYALRNVAEFGVAIDGNFMVLGRRFAGRRGDARLREYLYAGRADGSTKLHRLPTGPQRTDRDGAGPLDIEGGRVVFVWNRSVRFDTLGARQRVLAQGDLVGFALDGPVVYITSGYLGEGPNLSGNMTREDLSSGAMASSPGTELLDFAVDDGRFFLPDGRRIREVSPPPTFEP